MAELNSIDDSNWAEVQHINCYATFLGYLWIATRWLGLLVVTWTTVVLLGGFVSMLDKKDFWCLTVITLVQTAGVFNIHPSESLTAIARLCFKFLCTTTYTTIKWGGGRCVGAGLVAFGLTLIQAMGLSIMLGPVAVLYGLGLYITTAIAMWRTIKGDYGTSDGDGTNMNPAIRVLYTLAALQGFVFLYRIFLRFGEQTIVNLVGQRYKFQQGVDSPVLGYLDQVRTGCEKDPSFARGRNLITYAVDLMELESPDDLLSGTRILDTLITYDESLQSPENLPSTSVTIQTGHVNVPTTSSVNIPATRQEEQKGTRMAMVKERLIGSSSSGKIFQKLLKALDSRSPCDTEMRKRAARIVFALAGDIRLKQFPAGIGCISSLLDASLHEIDEYKEFMLQGLGIINKLATDEDNCRVMSDTDDLASMVMSPLRYDLLHCLSHDEWSAVVDASLQVMCTWLNTATGKSGEKLCSQIALNKEAISAMETMLICHECHGERLILAMKVLVTQIQDQENIIVQLLGIFIDYTKDIHITRLAGEKLLMLSKDSKNAKIMLEANTGPVKEIVRFLTEKRNIRICAAGILEGLCSHYIASHELSPNSVGKEPCFENLKKLMRNKMPELLLEILPQPRQRSRTVSQDHASQHTDIERQSNPVVSADNAQNVVQHEDKKLQAALLSLCFMVYHKMISTEVDLVPLLDAVCSKDPWFNLPGRLNEIVERNSDSTVVDCLRIVKCAAKMAKSMMRHKHSYFSEDLNRLMTSLEKARKEMSHLDAFVHLSGGDGGVTLSILVQQLARARFRPTEQGQKPEVSIKGKESENTEQGQQSSSGLSDGDCLREQFRPTEEAQQPEDTEKGKNSETIEPSSSTSIYEHGQPSSS